jgi:hypothetical protein
VLLFSSKNSVFTGQEKQNNEDTIKNHVFFDSKNFLKAAKFDRSNIQKKKEKYAPRFDRSTWKKFFSPIGPAVREKKGENFFSFGKNRILRKTKRNFFVFSFIIFAHFESL